MSEIICKEDARRLLQIRNEISKRLPIDNSLIPLDLLLVSAAGNDLGHHSVKSLFISLPHSSMGLRYHFQQLIDLNLLELYFSEEDKRVKIVVPSNLLKEKIQLITHEIRNIYNF
jgi:hypothetical protein